MELVINNLRKSFDKKEVLSGVNFTFEKGKIYGLIGRNGAGKTTLFNIINDDIAADDGEFYISENGMSRKLVQEDIGYVLSVPVVPDFLTAREFLKFFLDVNKKRLENPLSIDEYLEMVQIDVSDRDKLLKDFSHGMKNKIQMLVNFMAEPNILLLDEPLTSFDIVAADEMKKLLRRNKDNHIIIFSTHILEIALELCDEIVILNNGLLSEVTKDNLNNSDYTQKIISALKGEI
ncbi:MAG: ABC transporter ATP-binding protein [Clostridiales bacterium]|nr:ABC transporter ATP-binding protein [Clostridiales bacterium]